MNDRFKFRVWNKPGNSYISAKDDADFMYLEEEGNITVGLYDGDLEDMMYLKEEDLIIEWCTGLKDKNGRLIYEGDIVFHRDKSVEIGKVEWDKGGFFVVCNKWVIPWNFFTPSRWEVVGNIHENKELLKGKKDER